MGEVCKIVDIEPFVLRFWETEFPNLVPEKSKAGHRVYNAYIKGRHRDGPAHQRTALRARIHHRRRTQATHARPDAPRRGAGSGPIQVRKELQDILTLLRRKT